MPVDIPGGTLVSHLPPKAGAGTADGTEHTSAQPAFHLHFSRCNVSFIPGSAGTHQVRLSWPKVKPNSLGSC